jgi:hypothetical protein
MAVAQASGAGVDNHGASGYVFRNVAVPLSSKGRYTDIPEISRVTAVGCPTFVAVHIISEPASEDARAYCAPHTHPFGELCVLVGDPGQLVYEFRLGGEVVEVESPATVWQPAGLVHSANLRRGSGAFVVVYVGEPESGEATGEAAS